MSLFPINQQINSISDLLENAAHYYSNNTAICSEKKIFTYSELNRMANQIAYFVSQETGKENGVIGICMDRTVLCVVTMLGVLKAGFTVLPLNKQDSVERNQFKLEDSRAVGVLTDDDELSFSINIFSAIITYDHPLFKKEITHWKINLKQGSMGYVFYTSGSTGTPKGVINTHGNFVAHLRSFSEMCNFSEKDTVLGFAPFYFDASIEELFAVFMVGGCTYIIESECLTDVENIINILTRNPITVLSAPPAILRLLNQKNSLDLSKISLRLIVTGGDTLKNKDVDRFIGRISLMNGYGLTETTISSLWHNVASLDDDSIPIGKPMIGKNVYILNGLMQPVMPNEIGQIYLAGEGIAIGYINDPILTQQKFLPDKFSSIPNAKMFCTGDLGSYLDDATTVKFHGRVDRQISLRGYRIELEEIEHALVNFDLIQDAYVDLEQKGDNDKLIAYLVLKAEDVKLCDLVNYLYNKLSPYMIPNEFRVVTEIPKNSIGKIDAEKLYSVEYFILYNNTEENYSFTETQIVIRDIWKQVLCIPEYMILPTSSFFELGGTSIQLITVISKLREHFGEHLSSNKLLMKPTLSKQGEVVDRFQNFEKTSFIKNNTGTTCQTYDLSSAQQRIWFLSQLESEQSVYNTVTAHIIRGSLNISALQCAFERTLKKHAMLRTLFNIDNEKPYQTVMTKSNSVLILEEAISENFFNIVESAIVEEQKYVFDFTSEPLVRAKLLINRDDIYVMILNIHHLVVDNWSWKLIAEDIGSFYTEEIRGESSDKDHATPTYFDYIAYEKEQLSSEEMLNSKSFWEEKLSGDLPVLDLFSYTTRPIILGSNGKSIKHKIKRTTLLKLKQLCREEKISIYAATLAVLKVQLYRYTQQKDIIIGTPVVNRDIAGSEAIVGLFLNMIALRDEILPSEEFRKFAYQIHKNVQESLLHSSFPFEKVVEAVNPERNLSYSPIFQIVFDYHGNDTDIFYLENLLVESLPINARHSKYDLTITLSEENEELLMDFEYNSDLLSNLDIQRFVSHYIRILTYVINDTQSTPIKDIPYLTDEDMAVLSSINMTEKNYPLSFCIHQIFEQKAKEIPEKTAYYFLEESISYNELNNKANQLARLLQEYNIGKGSSVAICMFKSIELPIVLMAILKLGAIYIPLDPYYPYERLEQLLSIVNPDMIILDFNCYKSFSGYEKETQDLNDLFAKINIYAQINLSNISLPSDPMCVFFTSASTGEPKGVRLSIESVMNRLYWAYDYFRINSADRVANQKSYALVGSVWELFGGLLYGIPTYILPRENVIDPCALLKCLQSFDITMLFASPALLRGLLNEAEQQKQTANLRIGATSAEEIPIEMVAQWYRVFSKAHLYNLYGSTEDCSDVTVFDTVGMKKEYRSVPVGKPISNTRIYILDENGNLVPPGVSGEVFVAGIPVGLGYVNENENTIGKFRTLTIDGKIERVYATGDLSTLTIDGDLLLIGRIDHQVKVRGYKVDLSEIERVLKRCRGVHEVAVVTRNQDDNNQLIAYVVADKIESLTANKLRVDISKKLPHFMIPHIFCFIETMPKTPNGKLNRLALPDVDFNSRNDSIPYVEPRTPIERMISEIWQKILKAEKIGVHDNFFSLGGDSLSAIQMIGHLRHLLQIEYPLMELFEKPTISDISLYFQHSQSVDVYDFNYDKEKLSEYPLALNQESFWFYHQLEPTNVFYNIAANKLIGRLNYSVLKKAFEKVIDSHDALKMRFRSQNGTPYIVLDNPSNVVLPIIDLSALDAKEQDAEMLRLSRKEIDTPFDLENGPLIRAQLFKYKEDVHVLLINMHHIVSDGWSINILLSCISNNYIGFMKDPHYTPVVKTLQYSDYILWQNKQFYKDMVQQQRIYWKEKLSGEIPTLNLIEDKSRPEMFTYRGRIHQFTLDTSILKDLEILGRGNRCTLYMVFLSIYVTTLYKYTAQDTIMIGCPIAGRGNPEFEDVIGCFVNTLILKNEISDTMTFRDLLSCVRKTVLEAFTNASFPFDSLVSEINPKRDISRSPIFQAMMTMQDEPNNQLNIPGFDISDPGVINDLAPYDLSVIIWIVKSKATFYVEYYADIFEDETIRELFFHYQSILHQVIENPDVRLVDVSLFSAEKSSQLLDAWLREKVLIPHKSIHIDDFSDTLNHRYLVLDDNQKPIGPNMIGTLHVYVTNQEKSLYPVSSVVVLHDKTEIVLYNLGLDVYYLRDNKIYPNRLKNYNEDALAQSHRNNIDIASNKLLLRQIIDIWSDVLGCEVSDINSSFFDIGGTSIMLVKIAALLNEQLKIDIRIVDLIKYSTINSLVHFLSNDADKANSDSDMDLEKKEQTQNKAISRIKQIRKNANTSSMSSTPKFYVHEEQIRDGNKLFFCMLPFNASSNAYGKEHFSALSQCFPEDCGLICYRVSVEDTANPELSQIAEKIVDMIHKRQLHAPYLLGGWCNGGVMAFEVCRILHEKYQDVGTLVLLDTYEPAYQRYVNSNKELAYNFDQQFFFTFLLDCLQDSSIDHQKLINDISHIDDSQLESFALEYCKNKLSFSRKACESLLKKYKEVYRIKTEQSEQLLKTYQASIYRGKVLFFLIREKTDTHLDLLLGWNNLLVGDIVERHEMTGNHFTMLMQPDVQRIANVINQYWK